MRKTSIIRTLSLILGLFLIMKASFASALPGGTDAIEGLPEMPAVPTMATSAKGTSVTVTLSEEFKWLYVIQNWTRYDIIQWSDDGLTGTYSTKDLATQPGYSTWRSSYVTVVEDWESWNASGEKNSDYVRDIRSGTSTPRKDSASHREYVYGPGYYVRIPVTIYRNEWVDLDGETRSSYRFNYSDYYVLSENKDEKLEKLLSDQVAEAAANLVSRYGIPKEKDAPDLMDDFDTVSFYPNGIDLTYDHAQSSSDNNRMTTGGADGGQAVADFAYDGVTADGTHVKYGRYGELLQIGVELTGVNFLDTGKTPVRTTVNWCPLEHYGQKVWNFYIYEIIEEYEDGTKLTAHFSSSGGGKLLGTISE